MIRGDAEICWFACQMQHGLPLPSHGTDGRSGCVLCVVASSVDVRFCRDSGAGWSSAVAVTG